VSLWFTWWWLVRKETIAPPPAQEQGSAGGLRLATWALVLPFIIVWSA
jgi:hypothetical protein